MLHWFAASQENTDKTPALKEKFTFRQNIAFHYPQFFRDQVFQNSVAWSVKIVASHVSAHETISFIDSFSLVCRFSKSFIYEHKIIKKNNKESGLNDISLLYTQKNAFNILTLYEGKYAKRNRSSICNQIENIKWFKEKNLTVLIKHKILDYMG